MPKPSGKTYDAAYVRLVLWRASKAMEALDLASTASTGLCLSDFALLEALLHKGPMTVGALGKTILLTSGSVTTALDRLEKKKFLSRQADEDDRRITHVLLTDSGKLLISKAFRTHQKHLEETMSTVGPAERRQLTEVLKKIGKEAVLTAQRLKA